MAQPDGALVFVPNGDTDIVSLPGGPERWGNGTLVTRDDENTYEVWLTADGWNYESTTRPGAHTRPDMQGADDLSWWLQENWPFNRFREVE